ncbi:MAG TPA: hypothetical protein VFY14_09325 [Streptomyces sp.]|nr:hypothetical protein [Streptomyces sp.]
MSTPTSRPGPPQHQETTVNPTPIRTTGDDDDNTTSIPLDEV